jgi:hypothetical protein
MTIQFDLTDAKKYKAYFKLVTEKNKLLGLNKFMYGEIEIGQQEAASWKGRRLWAWPATRSRGSSQTDNYYLNREGTIWIGGASPSEKNDDKDEWYFECERIAKQILSRMFSDFAEAKLATSFSSYTLTRQDMTIGATTFIGCELVFTFADPDGLEYNADDWNP